MTDRPILFSAPMVRALLDGRKTQTRRTLKLPTKGQYIHPQMGGWEATTVGGGNFAAKPGGSTRYYPEKVAIWHRTTGKTIVTRWQKGDRLWVKEGWADVHPVAVQAGRYSQEGQAGIPGPPGVTYRTVYRVDGEPLQEWHCEDYPYRSVTPPTDPIALKHPTVCSSFKGARGQFVWEHGIHMPRWASRLTLIVTDVRVQRLHEISEADAEAEGCPACARRVAGLRGGCDSFICGYQQLWDDINGPNSWKANPWVIALAFTVEKRNIDA